MDRMQIRRKKTEHGGKKERLADIRRRTAWASGTEFFQNRDPLYHVTENFQQTFDAIGRRHAAELGGETGERPPEETETPADGDMSSRSFYERRSPEEQAMLHRFSETAFQRGTLSGAVLQGSGQMMLFSCLKKTVGQSQPDRWQQRKLFEKASPHRNSPGHTPDKVIFNRGFTDSAVGLVVDTLRDARRTVEDMRDLALGKSEMGMAGADTLRTMYPFLDDSREKALLKEYRTALHEKTSASPEERAALQNAAGRMEALIAKKTQMKQEFINKLRFISDRANEALEVFASPGFTADIHRTLEEAAAGAEPPPDDQKGAGHGSEKAGDDAGQEDGTNQDRDEKPK